MEKEFIPYEQVSSLIALGFNEPVIAHRQHGLDICLLKQPEVLLTDLSMILYQQAFRWFREKYGLIGWVEGKLMYKYCIESNIPTDGQLNRFPFKSYEEAELACLEKLIEIVESKTEK
jgi:hypothetical protein